MDKLRVLTSEESQLLKAVFGNEHSTSSGIPDLELDCLREGYFKEYHQLTALTGHILHRAEIEKLELGVTGGGRTREIQ